MNSDNEPRIVDAIEAILHLSVYLGVVGLGILGPLNGRPEVLALIPLAYIVIALDPRHGRWRHVWE